MRKQGNSTRGVPAMDAYRLAMRAQTAGVSEGAMTMCTGAATAGGDR